MDIYPSAIHIQKSRETVMQKLPNKSPNFQRKFNFPNKSPNLLRNRDKRLESLLGARNKPCGLGNHQRMSASIEVCH